MPAAVDNVTKAIATFNKAIDKVLREPVGPQRWRAANNLWLSLSPKHRKIYSEVCTENKQTRDELNKFGEQIGLSKAEKSDKTLRECLNIPAGAYIAISKADPGAFIIKNNSQKFFKEFPEYTTREVY